MSYFNKQLNESGFFLDKIVEGVHLQKSTPHIQNISNGGKTMINRIWHGWTIPENADKYERLLKEEIFTSIQEQGIPGFKGIQLNRRSINDNDELEFVTIMQFDSLDAVREFAGDDYKRAYVPEEAEALLAHFDQQARHYEVIVEQKGNSR